MFFDQDFKDLALNVILDKQDSSPNIPEFNASNGYVYRCNERHHFSSRRCHLKRHLTIEERVAKNLLLI